MKAIDKLKEITRFLKDCDIKAAEKEAEILIRHGAGIDTVKIYRDNPELRAKQITAVNEMVNRRLMREPLQYIVGYEEFLGLKLILGQGVLIPRPETEFMAEQAIKKVTSYKLQVTSESKDSSLITHHSSLSILDLCTGSGCLALALAKEFPDLHVYGSDISEIAVDYAKNNAQINKIKNVVFFRGYLFEPFKYSQLFDIIISNPPYIRTDDIKNLQPEIREWEPLNAVDGGVDGLDFYGVIIPEARQHLKDKGLLMLEVGGSYISEITDMVEYAGYTRVNVIKDYAGIDRIIQAEWKS